jgi:ribosomal protein L32
MKCSNCGHENRPGVRFCEECGQQLMEAVPVTACPACGHSNRPGARFCEECGQPLVRERPRLLRRLISRVWPLSPKRLLVGGLVVVLLILVGRFVYFGSRVAIQIVSPPSTTKISEQEILETAEERVREVAPWMAEVQPTVEEVEFRGDQGYVVTYQRDVEVRVEDERATVTQILLVHINAVTGQVSIAQSQ